GRSSRGAVTTKVSRASDELATAAERIGTLFAAARDVATIIFPACGGEPWPSQRLMTVAMSVCDHGGRPPPDQADRLRRYLDDHDSLSRNPTSQVTGNHTYGSIVHPMLTSALALAKPDASISIWVASTC